MSTDGYVYIHPKLNPTKVLGCASGGTANQTPIVIFHVDGTANQKWHWQVFFVGNNTYYTFRPHHDETKGFDTNNGDNNTVWLWSYDSNNYNQRFVLYLEDAVNGWVSLHRWGDGHTVVANDYTENSHLTVINNYTSSNQYGWFQLEAIATPSQSLTAAKSSLQAVLKRAAEQKKQNPNLLEDIKATAGTAAGAGEKVKAKKAAKKKAPAKAKKATKPKAKAKKPATKGKGKGKKTPAKKKASPKAKKAAPKAKKAKGKAKK